MNQWICGTCAVEQPAGETPPSACPICQDERQYVPPSGQRWTTLAELSARGCRGSVQEVEPGLYGVSVTPAVGIGQRSLLVQTAAGNVLWDPPGYVDDDLSAAVEAVGGVAAVATSHPHMFGVQLEWSRRFGAAPVFVAAADREWLQRDGAAVQLWDHDVEVVTGVTLHRIGGHFPGSAVLRYLGSDGRAVLLCGDTAVATPDERWVSFLRSYPNKIPLSAATVQRIADRLALLEFDRLYDNVGGRVGADAAQRVRRSADRYIAWVRGDFDHLT